VGERAGDERMRRESLRKIAGERDFAKRLQDLEIALLRR